MTTTTTTEKKLIWTQEELPQGSAAWKEFRSEGLGGSEVASLMHENPYEDLVTTWKIKCGLYDPYADDDGVLPAHIARGNELEPRARRLYQRLTGDKVEQLCLLHPEHHWMRTSLDGITLDRTAVLEIKCPKSLDNHRKQTAHGVYPLYRKAQMMHQLAVCRAHFPTIERVDYFSYYDDDNYVLIKVYPDFQYINELMRRERIFYHDFVLPRRQPPSYLFKAEEPLYVRKAAAA